MNVKKSIDYIPTPVIDNLKSDCNVELTAVNCPKLLKKGKYRSCIYWSHLIIIVSELKFLFVDMDLSDRNVTVLNLSQKTGSDMAAWSPDMEIERMKLTASVSFIYIFLLSNLCFSSLTRQQPSAKLWRNADIGLTSLTLPVVVLISGSSPTLPSLRPMSATVNLGSRSKILDVARLLSICSGELTPLLELSLLMLLLTLTLSSRLWRASTLTKPRNYV